MSVRAWLDAYKPAGSPRIHLLLAAATWSTVGSLLLTVGLRWVLHTHHRYAPLLMVAAAATGVAKSHFVLRRAALRIVDRIRSRGDNRCIGGFLSVRTWVVVAVMAGLGRWMRTGALPQLVVGLLYVGVGTALLLASRHLWRAWSHARQEP